MMNTAYIETTLLIGKTIQHISFSIVVIMMNTAYIETTLLIGKTIQHISFSIVVALRRRKVSSAAQPSSSGADQKVAEKVHYSIGAVYLNQNAD